MVQEIGATLAILAGERWIAARRTAREARPVRMVCLLSEAGPAAAAATTCPPARCPWPLTCSACAGDAERERRRFARYADLMSHATLMRLTCDTDDRPADLADLIERALADRPALAAGGTR